MNNVCITYKNGKRDYYSYFSNEFYLKLKRQGKIKKVRPLTLFDIFVVRLKVKLSERMR